MVPLPPTIASWIKCRRSAQGIIIDALYQSARWLMDATQDRYDEAPATYRKEYYVKLSSEAAIKN